MDISTYDDDDGGTEAETEPAEEAEEESEDIDVGGFEEVDVETDNASEGADAAADQEESGGVFALVLMLIVGAVLYLIGDDGDGGDDGGVGGI